MPNWCSNYLKVEGEGIEKFKSLIKDNMLQFSQFVSIPEAMEDIHSGSCTVDGKECSSWREVDGKIIPVSNAELKSLKFKYAATDWYTWNINNWGTKWDISKNGFVNYGSLSPEDSNPVECTFETAWSPPNRWLQTVSRIYPELTFTLACAEQGAEFYGTLVVKNGNFISEDVQQGNVHNQYTEADGDEDEFYNDHSNCYTKPFLDHLKKYKLSPGG